MGMILGEAGRWKEALESDRQALAIYESVSRTDPDSQEDAHYVATMRARIAALTQRHQH
jgi:hypothetical protein